MRYAWLFVLSLSACGGGASGGGGAGGGGDASTGCSDGIKNGDETDVDCGGGTCAACDKGKACQAGSDCASSSCVAHACATPPSQCSDGTKNGAESDVDCGGGTCATCANGKACVAASDCSSKSCASHLCAAPPSQCADATRNGAETDVDCGGGTCAPCANGKACVVSTDCMSASCTGHVCVTPVAQCLDNSKNGNETDVDCGGGTCGPCANGKVCISAADCVSGSCTGHVCVTPVAQCLDNTRNGNESDVDCGGGTCPPCSNGKACVGTADCTSGTCTGHVCISPSAQCLDNTRNGNETDVDCGGGTCPPCGNGKACVGAADCTSGTCSAKACVSPPAQCLDNTKNGNETDVDCGGGTCPACTNGKSCAQISDCQSGTCKSGSCSSPPSQCLDNTRNGTETDVDCGGGTCAACGTGKACLLAADCASGNCDASSMKCSAAAPACTVICLDTSCSCSATCGGHSYAMGCEGSGTDTFCFCEPDGQTMQGPTSMVDCTSVAAIFKAYSSASPTGCGFPGTMP